MGIKKRLGLAMATTALGATLLAGGSFALFTSSATNEGNTFTSGTVIITDKTVGSLVSQDVNFNNLAPGDTKVLTMTVKNEGTLEEWVRIDSAATIASKTGALFAGATPVSLTLDPKVVKLAPGETTTFDVTYLFPLAADNTYQNATGSFKVIVNAVQARNNTTGNGPTTWQ
ncbi:hypothetical protein J31TS4_33970 [Paenibacillus sp. J31TS4]|uniref:TasA family protein n=1 Tax=Paenibacillus sp. J31TS4 TaxID=2807195 RepID=UPI001B1AAADC|nr:TasA family protein [Paenibacillus sp. J31TS4]GIP40117.1 hypothetical protein J31TS4_33970 [Paenibacillus sp. J31TS4]